MLFRVSWDFVGEKEKVIRKEIESQKNGGKVIKTERTEAQDYIGKD